MGYKPNHVTIELADKSIVCLTQPGSILCHYIHYRLEVRR
jgi:hypothetical protein